MCGEEKKTAMYNALLTVSSVITPGRFRHSYGLCSPLKSFQFGAGHRSCLGKHLAYFEIYKLIPSLLQRYDVSGNGKTCLTSLKLN